MESELILDIGIGSGGKYIRDQAKSHQRRIGIDTEPFYIHELKRDYPEVEGHVANAEHLPFPDNTFTQIDMVLPKGSLLVPGLANDHLALRQEYKAEMAQQYPDGWYPEFSRVLRPGSDMVIFGDLWVNPPDVQRTAERFFDTVSITPLAVEELEALGTSQVEYVIKQGRGTFVKELGKRWDDTLIKIILRSKKPA